MNNVVWFGILLFYATVPYSTSGQSLLDVLQSNKNLTKFASYVKTVNPYFLNQTTPITLIAPNNHAIDQIASQLRWDTLDDERKQFILAAHAVPEILSTSDWNRKGIDMQLIDIGFGTGRWHMLPLTENFFTFQTKGVQSELYLINQAIITEKDIPAQNSLIHVSDRMLYYPFSKERFTEFLMNQAVSLGIKTTRQLWMKHYYDGPASKIMDTTKYATLFMVTDQGWSGVSKDALNKLMENSTLRTEVLAHQYFPNQLIFSEWTLIHPILNIFSGFPKTASINKNQLNPSQLFRSLDGTITVSSGNTASQLVGESILINNMVIHLVNSPLGFIHETREQIMQRLNANMLSACRADMDCNTLLNSKSDITIFVPNTGAMQAFNRLTSAEKNIYLKYMFLPLRLTRKDMNEVRTIKVNQTDEAIRFRIENQSVFLEGRLSGHGYVAARIESFDMLATDGVVHEINAVPALPVETVEEYLMRKTQFSQFRQYRFVESMKKGAPYTFLVPTNAAILKMQNDIQVGRSLLLDQKRKEYIFRRHSLPFRLFIDDLSPQPTYNASTANYAFTGEFIQLKLQIMNGQKAGFLSQNGATAKIFTRTGQYEFTNGWVYELDNLLYTQADLTANMCTNPHC